jgi:hypothetical protein
MEVQKNEREKKRKEILVGLQRKAWSTIGKSDNYRVKKMPTGEVFIDIQEGLSYRLRELVGSKK